jgi:hypothetical protein
MGTEEEEDGKIPTKAVANHYGFYIAMLYLCICSK